MAKRKCLPTYKGKRYKNMQALMAELDIAEIAQSFLSGENQALVESLQSFVEPNLKMEEVSDVTVQKQTAEKMDVRQQSEDGETMGTEDSQGQEVTKEGQKEEVAPQPAEVTETAKTETEVSLEVVKLGQEKDKLQEVIDNKVKTTKRKYKKNREQTIKHLRSTDESFVMFEEELSSLEEQWNAKRNELRQMEEGRKLKETEERRKAKAQKASEKKTTPKKAEPPKQQTTKKQEKKESKEAWEMTKEEHKEASKNKDAADGVHRFMVQTAVNEGKPVPAEVLKDYPEFQAAKERKEKGIKSKELTKEEKAAIAFAQKQEDRKKKPAKEQGEKRKERQEIEEKNKLKEQEEYKAKRQEESPLERKGRLESVLYEIRGLAKIPKRVPERIVRAVLGKDGDMLLTQKAAALIKAKTDLEKTQIRERYDERIAQQIIKAYEKGKIDPEAITEFDKFIEEKATKKAQKTEQTLKGVKKTAVEGEGYKAKNQKSLAGVFRDVFGMSQKQADVVAVIGHQIIKSMAKRAGITVAQMYDRITWRTSTPEKVGVKKEDAPTTRSIVEMFEDSTAIITALTDPNISSPIHELVHIYRQYLSTDEKMAVLDWTEQTQWDGKTDELFARGAIKYLHEKKAPMDKHNKVIEKLKSIFQDFGNWLTELFGGIVGAEIDVPPLSAKMREVYARMYQATTGELLASEERNVDRGEMPFRITEGKLTRIYKEAKRLLAGVKSADLGEATSAAEILDAIKNLPQTGAGRLKYHPALRRLGYDGAKKFVEAFVNSNAHDELMDMLLNDRLNPLHAVYTIRVLIEMYQKELKKPNITKERKEEVMNNLAKVTEFSYRGVGINAAQTLEAMKGIYKALHGEDPYLLAEKVAERHMWHRIEEALITEHGKSPEDVRIFQEKLFEYLKNKDLKLLLKVLDGEEIYLSEADLERSKEMEKIQILLKEYGLELTEESIISLIRAATSPKVVWGEEYKVVQELQSQLGADSKYDIVTIVQGLIERAENLLRQTQELEAEKQVLLGENDLLRLKNADAKALVDFVKENFPLKTFDEAIAEIKKAIDVYNDFLGATVNKSQKKLLSVIESLLHGLTNDQQIALITDLIAGRTGLGFGSVYLKDKQKTWTTKKPVWPMKKKRSEKKKMEMAWGSVEGLNQMLEEFGSYSIEKKRNFLKKNIELIINRNVLDNGEFLTMIAELFGIPTMTDAVKEKLRTMLDYHNKYIDSVDEYVKNPKFANRWEMFKRSWKAKQKELWFAMELSTMGRFAKLTKFGIQGNLLVPFVSYLRNIYANIMRMPFSAASNILATGVDAAISGVAQVLNTEAWSDNTGFERKIKQMFQRQRTMNAFIGMPSFWVGFVRGGVETSIDMFTKYGISPSELSKRDAIEVFNITRSMDKVWGQMFRYIAKKMPRMVGETKAEYKERQKESIKKYAESADIKDVYAAVFLPMAEVSFRLLAFGDKPFRTGYEHSKLREMAWLFGLKGKEARIFRDTRAGIVDYWMFQIEEQKSARDAYVKELNDNIEKSEELKKNSPLYQALETQRKQIRDKISELDAQIEKQGYQAKIDKIKETFVKAFGFNDADMIMVMKNLPEFIRQVADEFGAQYTYQSDIFMSGPGVGLFSSKPGFKAYQRSKGATQGATIKGTIQKGVENMLLRQIDNKFARKAVANLFEVGMSAVLPYEKTLLNIAVEVAKWGSPNIMAGFALVDMYQGRKNEAAKKFGTAIFGMAWRHFIIHLAEMGIINPEHDRDETKEREYAYTEEGRPGGRINITALQRYISSGFKSHGGYKENDKTLSLIYLGTPGVLAHAIANYYKAKTDEGEQVNPWLMPDFVNFGKNFTGESATGKYVGSILRAMTETSFMQSVNIAINVFTAQASDRQMKQFLSQVLMTATVVPHDPTGAVTRRYITRIAEENLSRVCKEESFFPYFAKSVMKNYSTIFEWFGITDPTKEKIINVWGDVVPSTPRGFNKWKYAFLYTNNPRYKGSYLNPYRLHLADIYDRLSIVYGKPMHDNDVIWYRNEVNVETGDTERKEQHGTELDANRLLPPPVGNQFTFVDGVADGDGGTILKSYTVKLSGKDLDSVRIAIGQERDAGLQEIIESFISKARSEAYEKDEDYRKALDVELMYELETMYSESRKAVLMMMMEDDEFRDRIMTIAEKDYEELKEKNRKIREYRKKMFEDPLEIDGVKMFKYLLE